MKVAIACKRAGEIRDIQSTIQPGPSDSSADGRPQAISAREMAASSSKALGELIEMNQINERRCKESDLQFCQIQQMHIEVGEMYWQRYPEHSSGKLCLFL